MSYSTEPYQLPSHVVVLTNKWLNSAASKYPEAKQKLINMANHNVPLIRLVTNQPCEPEYRYSVYVTQEGKGLSMRDHWQSRSSDSLMWQDCDPAPTFRQVVQLKSLGINPVRSLNFLYTMPLDKLTRFILKAGILTKV